MKLNIKSMKEMKESSYSYDVGDVIKFVKTDADTGLPKYLRGKIKEVTGGHKYLVDVDDTSYDIIYDDIDHEASYGLSESSDREGTKYSTFNDGDLEVSIFHNSEDGFWWTTYDHEDPMTWSTSSEAEASYWDQAKNESTLKEMLLYAGDRVSSVYQGGRKGTVIDTDEDIEDAKVKWDDGEEEYVEYSYLDKLYENKLAPVQYVVSHQGLDFCVIDTVSGGNIVATYDSEDKAQAKANELNGEGFTMNESTVPSWITARSDMTLYDANGNSFNVKAGTSLKTIKDSSGIYVIHHDTSGNSHLLAVAEDWDDMKQAEDFQFWVGDTYVEGTYKTLLGDIVAIDVDGEEHELSKGTKVLVSNSSDPDFIEVQLPEGQLRYIDTKDKHLVESVKKESSIPSQVTTKDYVYLYTLSDNSGEIEVPAGITLPVIAKHDGYFTTYNGSTLMLAEYWDDEEMAEDFTW